MFISSLGWLSQEGGSRWPGQFFVTSPLLGPLPTTKNYLTGVCKSRMEPLSDPHRKDSFIDKKMKELLCPYTLSLVAELGRPWHSVCLVWARLLALWSKALSMFGPASPSKRRGTVPPLIHISHHGCIFTYHHNHLIYMMLSESIDSKKKKLDSKDMIMQSISSLDHAMHLWLPTPFRVHPIPYLIHFWTSTEKRYDSETPVDK